MDEKYVRGMPGPRQLTIYLSISLENTTSWNVQSGAMPHVTHLIELLFLV